MTRRRIFGQPGFPLLFSGQLATMAGDSLMLLVLAIWVKDLTGSNGAAGLTFFFLALPALAGPLMGLFIDRLKRRTVLIWGNLVSALIVCPLFAVNDSSDVWIIYTVAALYGLSFVVMPAALNGLLKEMLPEETLVDANASLATTKEALRLIGPLIGAGIYTVAGGAGVAAIDAASFVYAGLVIALLRIREEAPERVEQHWKDEILAGIRHIWNDEILLHTLAAVGIALLVVGFLESAVFSMLDAFDKPPTFVGVIVSVQGVGAIVGGLSSARLVRTLGEPQAIAMGLASVGLGLVIAAAAPVLAVVFVGVVFLGFGLPVFVVAFTTLLQLRTPQALMGRVSTATDVVMGTPQSLSLAAGALLISFFDYRTMYIATAAVFFVAAGYLRARLGSFKGTANLARAGEIDGALDVGPAGLPIGATALELGSAVARRAGAELGEEPAEIETRRLDRQGDE
jgi:MFS family permease